MTDFLLQNVSLSIYIILAFTMFGLTWLHWDAEYIRKSKHLQYRLIGFGLIGFAFITRVFTTLGSEIFVAYLGLLSLGMISLAIGIYNEPILPSNLAELIKHPHRKDKSTQKITAVAPLFLSLPILPALVSAYATIGVWRRYRSGKTHDYAKFAMGLSMLTIALVLESMQVLATSSIIIVSTFFAPLGVAWILEHIALAVATLFLLKWLWTYIKFRVHPEMFITFATGAIIISTFTALFYSVSLYSRSEKSVLDQLEKGSQVFSFAIDNLSDASLDTATLIASSSEISTFLSNQSTERLHSSALKFAEKTTSVDELIFVNETATILVNTANESTVEQTLTDDPLIIHALTNAEKVVSARKMSGVLGDDIVISAVHPIFDNAGQLIGAVEANVVIDDAFVDKVKEQTKLETAVYVDKRRSATTILDTQNLTRRENLLDDSPELKSAISNGTTASGVVTIVNVDYHGAYAPLENASGEVIGATFVGQPVAELLLSVQSSIYATFLVSIAISAAALLPAYTLASRIEKGGV